MPLYNPSSGGGAYFPHNAYISGRWYEAGVEAVCNPFSTNGTALNGKIFAYPAYFYGPATIAALGARVGTAGAAGDKAQVALYDHDPSAFRPTGLPLVASGDLSVAATGPVSTTLDNTGATINKLISSPKILWFCSNTSALAPLLSGHQSALMDAIGGSSTQANLSTGSTRLSAVQVASIPYGTWPDMTSASFTELTNSVVLPTVQFKVA